MALELTPRGEESHAHLLANFEEQRAHYGIQESNRHMGPVLAVLDFIKNAQADPRDVGLPEVESAITRQTVERLKKDGFILDTEEDI